MAALCKICERKIKVVEGEDVKDLCPHCLRVKTKKEKLIAKQMAKESKPAALKKKLKELEQELKKVKTTEPTKETVKDETVKEETVKEKTVKDETLKKPKPKAVKK